MQLKFILKVVVKTYYTNRRLATINIILTLQGDLAQVHRSTNSEVKTQDLLWTNMWWQNFRTCGPPGMHTSAPGKTAAPARPEKCYCAGSGPILQYHQNGLGLKKLRSIYCQHNPPGILICPLSAGYLLLSSNHFHFLFLYFNMVS